MLVAVRVEHSVTYLVLRTVLLKDDTHTILLITYCKLTIHTHDLMSLFVVHHDQLYNLLVLLQKFLMQLCTCNVSIIGI